jgi:hypothetical protein
MTTQEARTRPYGCTACPTLSGAQIRSVDGETAARLLCQFGLSTDGQPDFSLAAYDDGGLVIGALATAPLMSNLTTVWIAVAPQRRRLKVATDLFDTVLVSHIGEMRHGFLFRHRANSPIAVAFLASLQLSVLPIAPDETLVTFEQNSDALQPALAPRAPQTDDNNLGPSTPLLGHPESR